MVNIISTEVLSDNFFQLKKIKFAYQKFDGSIEELSREVYMSKNGAVVLLYNLEKSTVILTKQFRLPTYLNNNATGIMIEACAGIVEPNEDPQQAVIREIEEETGYRVSHAEKVFEMYMTPGSVAEMLYFFTAAYSADQQINNGGGLAQENEDIEVIEVLFDKAYNQVKSGEIKDAKTALLLQYAKINLFNTEKVFDAL